MRLRVRIVTISVCAFRLRCDASGHSQKDKRRDSSSTSSPPPTPLSTHTHTHRAKCLLASASLIHPFHDVHGLNNSDVCSSPSPCNYMCAGRQTDRQTDRQWGGSDRTELYLYIPVVILLPHREMTHFHCSVCVCLSRSTSSTEMCFSACLYLCVPARQDSLLTSAEPSCTFVAFTVREHERGGASLQIRGFVDGKHGRTSASVDIAP